MSLKSILAAAALAGLPMAGHSAPINDPVPSDNYVTIDGVDWAWANPCDAFGVGFSCGVVDMSYQSTQGWHIATVSEVATYILPNIAGFLANFGTETNFKCASAWFSTVWQHCDWGDAVDGLIYNGALPNEGYFESFAVRGLPSVPVPAAGLLLVTALGGVAALRRRRRG